MLEHQWPDFFGPDKRYYSWNTYLRQQFGEKVFKVPLNGGFNCPNRDGTVAYGGCTFCSPGGSGEFAGDRHEDIAEQFQTVRQRMLNKWPHTRKFISYFQAYTNTYAPVAVLRSRYEAALQQEGVVGLSIATRPDCLPDDVIAYLKELNQRTFLWVELGLQTIHERTAQLINRGHDYACFLQGVDRLRAAGIRVCVHIIDGLPGETPEMMFETAKAAASLDVQGIKIHLLHLLKKTAMVRQYEKGQLHFLDFKTYVGLVCDQLEIMPAQMVIQRLTGDGPADLMIGPMWSLKKWEVLDAIDDELKKRDSWQGKGYQPPSAEPAFSPESQHPESR